MSVELWKEIFDWASVILVGLTFIAGAGALITGKILSDRQSGQIRQFDKDLTNAKNDLAEQQIRAANLESGNLQLRTELQNSIAESTKRQTELEIEQRKTAEAQQKAAGAQLALREAVEHAAASRRIIMGSRNGDQEIRQSRFNELAKFSNTPTIIVFVQDEEAQILAWDIRDALMRAGWKSVAIMDRTTAGLPLGLIEEGVQIRTLWKSNDRVATAAPSPGIQLPPVVEALRNLLDLDLGPPAGAPFGVPWEPDLIANGKPLGILTRYGFQIPDGGVVITVGRKPTWEYFLGLPNTPEAKKK